MRGCRKKGDPVSESDRNTTTQRYLQVFFLKGVITLSVVLQSKTCLYLFIVPRA